MQETIEVTGGIRQGCSISTLLFKMVKYNIIEEMKKKPESYEVGIFTENTLWLGDDITLIANSKETLEENIRN